MDNDTSGGMTPPMAPVPNPSARPSPKRPTGIKATLVYNSKPKRLTGLKVLVFVIVAMLAIMSVRLLAAPGGGPLMDAYHFVKGILVGAPAGNAAQPEKN